MGCTAVHLVGGIWGQLAVGFFADPPTGPKGLFLGGGPNQLIVQAISSASLTIWAVVSTLLILMLVNSIIPIRLSREDEIRGCDLAEHNIGEGSGNELQKSMATFNKIIQITTPIMQRFAGNVDERNQRNGENVGRRKPFHANEGFDGEPESI